MNKEQPLNSNLAMPKVNVMELTCLMRKVIQFLFCHLLLIIRLIKFSTLNTDEYKKWLYGSIVMLYNTKRPTWCRTLLLATKLNQKT